MEHSLGERRMKSFSRPFYHASHQPDAGDNGVKPICFEEISRDDEKQKPTLLQKTKSFINLRRLKQQEDNDSLECYPGELKSVSKSRKSKGFPWNVTSASRAPFSSEENNQTFAVPAQGLPHGGYISPLNTEKPTSVQEGRRLGHRRTIARMNDQHHLPLETKAQKDNSHLEDDYDETDHTLKGMSRLGLVQKDWKSLVQPPAPGLQQLKALAKSTSTLHISGPAPPPPRNNPFLAKPGGLGFTPLQLAGAHTPEPKPNGETPAAGAVAAVAAPPATPTKPRRMLLDLDVGSSNRSSKIPTASRRGRRDASFGRQTQRSARGGGGSSKKTFSTMETVSEMYHSSLLEPDPFDGPIGGHPMRADANSGSCSSEMQLMPEQEAIQGDLLEFEPEKADPSGAIPEAVVSKPEKTEVTDSKPGKLAIRQPAGAAKKKLGRVIHPFIYMAELQMARRQQESQGMEISRRMAATLDVGRIWKETGSTKEIEEAFRSLPKDMLCLEIKLFAGYKQGDEDKAIVPAWCLDDLVLFRNLRTLKVTGMISGYQHQIWQCVWVNDRMLRLTLEMLVEPELTSRVATTKWIKVSSGWSPDRQPIESSQYMGNCGEGDVDPDHAYGEYLDQKAIGCAHSRALKWFESVQEDIPLISLDLKGFVFDHRAIVEWFDPSKFRELKVDHRCYDCGFSLAGTEFANVRAFCTTPPLPRPAQIVHAGKAKLIDIGPRDVQERGSKNTPEGAGATEELPAAEEEGSSSAG